MYDSNVNTGALLVHMQMPCVYFNGEYVMTKLIISKYYLINYLAYGRWMDGERTFVLGLIRAARGRCRCCCTGLVCARKKNSPG